MNSKDQISSHNETSQQTESQACDEQYAKRTLFLCNIPPKANSISHLIAHYKRFGHIDAINCSGTHATIIFEKEESAQAALESPLTVLRNRFIKIAIQDPHFPNAADLTKYCDFHSAEEAAKQSLKNAKMEDEETQLIRADLKKEAEFRKYKQSQTELNKLKSELDLMLKETEEIILKMSELDEEDQKKSKNRLTSLSILITAAENRIHTAEDFIHEFEANMDGDED